MSIPCDEVVLSKFPSFDPLAFQNHEDADFSLPFSHDLDSNTILHYKMMSMRHADFNSLLSQTTSSDDGEEEDDADELLYHILAYTPNSRYASSGNVGRQAAEEQHISDFQHVASMLRSLIFEYSRFEMSFQARHDAVDAIQNYLISHLNKTILPKVSHDSSYQVKLTALSTLTKIIFSTLPIEKSLNRINGLLHARVCDLVGGAMFKLTDTLSHEDFRLLVQEKELVSRMRELQKSVAQVRWPIDGLERIIALLEQKNLRGTIRHSSQILRIRKAMSREALVLPLRRRISCV